MTDAAPSGSARPLDERGQSDMRSVVNAADMMRDTELVVGSPLPMCTPQPSTVRAHGNHGHGTESHINECQKPQTHSHNEAYVCIPTNTKQTTASTSATCVPFITTLAKFHHGLQLVQGTAQQYLPSKQLQNCGGYHNNLKDFGVTKPAPEAPPLPLGQNNGKELPIQAN